ncbi:hypothetical protein AWB65_05374 [Caballeronia humi]|uniref:Uncharacterized protein n=1 Tax=Caballeronia humi TaxID=326474 RepID=A0A158ITC1_9BURK|nr:hypothetical protein AWB65_05374 [Caballeronia humi]
MGPPRTSLAIALRRSVHSGSRTSGSSLSRVKPANDQFRHTAFTDFLDISKEGRLTWLALPKGSTDRRFGLYGELRRNKLSCFTVFCSQSIHNCLLGSKDFPTNYFEAKFFLAHGLSLCASSLASPRWLCKRWRNG